MPVPSAGLLVFRRTGRSLEVLLVHPGGPFWAAKDEGSWSVPKGEFDPAAETALAAARREFEEETGHRAPASDPVDLGTVVQRSGKVVHAFAAEGDLDASQIVSNTFTMEWPPRSGRRRAFPEVDRAEWFDLPSARLRLLPSQAPLIERLAEALAGD